MKLPLRHTAACLVACTAFAPVTMAAEKGFTPLFNGKDLTGWFYNQRANKTPGKPPAEQKSGKGYQVENGVVFCTKTDGGHLYTEKEFRDFILRFEFKLEAESNNGIGIRAPKGGHASRDGMEIQVLDDNAEKHAKLRPAQFHGSIYDVVAAKRGHLKPIGQWNSQEIIAQGPRIKITLNGAVIVDANLDDIKDEAVLKKHSGLRSPKGSIVLCGHGTRVEFRNMRIKEL